MAYGTLWTFPPLELPESEPLGAMWGRHEWEVTPVFFKQLRFRETPQPSLLSALLALSQTPLSVPVHAPGQALGSSPCQCLLHHLDSVCVSLQTLWKSFRLSLSDSQAEHCFLQLHAHIHHVSVFRCLVPGPAGGVCHQAPVKAPDNRICGFPQQSQGVIQYLCKLSGSVRDWVVLSGVRIPGCCLAGLVHRLPQFPLWESVRAEASLSGFPIMVTTRAIPRE